MKHWLPISTARTCRQPGILQEMRTSDNLKCACPLHVYWICQTQRNNAMSNPRSTKHFWWKWNLKWLHHSFQMLCGILYWMGGVKCSVQLLYIFCLPSWSTNYSIKRGFLNSILTFSSDFECTDLSSAQRPPNWIEWNYCQLPSKEILFAHFCKLLQRFRSCK